MDYESDHVILQSSHPVHAITYAAHIYTLVHAALDGIPSQTFISHYNTSSTCKWQCINPAPTATLYHTIQGKIKAHHQFDSPRVCQLSEAGQV